MEKLTRGLAPSENVSARRYGRGFEAANPSVSETFFRAEPLNIFIYSLMRGAVMAVAPEKIAAQARKALSSYCSAECKAYCCRRGYLTLDDSNIALVSQGMQDELVAKKVITKVKEGRYSLYIGDYENPCPSLKNNICLIHSSRKRPKACREFPIIVRGNNVCVSLRCPAVNDGLLYPYLRRLKKLGFNISYSHMFADFDFNSMINK